MDTVWPRLCHALVQINPLIMWVLDPGGLPPGTWTDLIRRALAA